jgi:hypothetical protein
VAAIRAGISTIALTSTPRIAPSSALRHIGANGVTLRWQLP